MCLALEQLAPAATVTVGSWTPLFQGIELAHGQQQAVSNGELNQQALCLRVDLTDPNIALFTTPHCSGCGLETVSEYTSHFLEQYGLQVAINGGFYSSSSGPSDTALGTAEDVYGLAMCQGAVVSPADNLSYAATLLFTANNLACFLPTNSPATNTGAFYTAISGNHALLVHGVNLGTVSPNDLDPRTALGLSQDRRYLYLMTLDGRQPGWSDGADFHDTAEWLLRFGAADGINVDGGGSTTMVMADCQGGAVRLNRSSFVAAYGRERNTGHNFGVYAKPLPTRLENLSVDSGTTTALITWDTAEEASSQVEYGLSSAYGNSTALDARPLRHHVTTLTGLAQGSNYFFRATSITAGQALTQACQFTTLTSVTSTQLFGLTQTWVYTTNNLDSTGWKTPGYSDLSWLGSGPGLLYVEDNPEVNPKNTALPPGFGRAIPRTYYFRTHFAFSGSVSGAALTFSNYVDDGAVFYLNGAEIYRLRMPAAPAAISYSTAATGVPCAGTLQSGDALSTCPDVFTVSGNLLTNLVEGDNVLAVEVHNYTSGNDLVFGSALMAVRPVVAAPRLTLWWENGWGTLFWNGQGFTLQQSSNLAAEPAWTDCPGPVTQSPVCLSNAPACFYRLRQ
jgi:hypothetical protein